MQKSFAQGPSDVQKVLGDQGRYLVLEGPLEPNGSPRLSGGSFKESWGQGAHQGAPGGSRGPSRGSQKAKEDT